MERTLSAVGTPLIIDNATSKHIFGHYAKVIVDMDFPENFFMILWLSEMVSLLV